MTASICKTRCTSPRKPECVPEMKIYPLERAAEVYECMMSGKARFGVVLTTK